MHRRIGGFGRLSNTNNLGKIVLLLVYYLDFIV